MPNSAVKPCRHYGCAAVTNHTTGYCEQHRHIATAQREQLRRRGKTTARGYGHRWRKLRALQLAEHPLCACGEVATLVDHITPILDGGAKYDRKNLQSMCRGCHDVKTQHDIDQRQQVRTS